MGRNNGPIKALINFDRQTGRQREFKPAHHHVHFDIYNLIHMYVCMYLRLIRYYKDIFKQTFVD